MIDTISSREILKNSEIKNRLKECFKKCALGRIQLRKCIVNAMSAGLTKDNVLTLVDKMVTGNMHDESSLCAIIAIGQVLRYKEKHENNISFLITDNKREEIETKLKGCFKKCILAKRQLGKCIINALDAGLSKEEILAISDDIVGGLAKREVSLCAIIAVNQLLLYEESSRAKPIDIVKERQIEREDT